jgi:hypothetical protein
MTTKSHLLAVIRRNCLDCTCQVPSEVARCSLKGCPLHPFRMGRDPNPARSSPARPFGKNVRPGKTEIQAIEAVQVDGGPIA